MNSAPYTQFRTRYPTAEEERPKFGRRIGLQVPEEERRRVDRFILGFLENSELRIFALSVLDEGRKENPATLSDRTYFALLGKRLIIEAKLEPEIVRFIWKLPVSAQGSAFSVAMNRKWSDPSEYPMREFHRDLIMDEWENVAGEKEEQILGTVNPYLHGLDAQGWLGREGESGIMFRLGEWLREATAEDKNLLYYGEPSLRALLDCASKSPNFRALREMILAVLPQMADEISRLEPSKRIYSIAAFAEDVKASPERARDLVREIRFTSAYHGAGLY